MIDGINIKDFKSHKDTRIEFSPGVNVFVGLSDHGKTNIIRSINWVFRNRPLGEGVINRDSTEASVKITVSHANETNTVLRIKGNSVNEYVLNGDTEHPFTAFGSDPPPQIIGALNFSDINLQRQFEPYFLVFDSPGQVATFIRSITKLDEIDQVIDIINRQIKKNHTEIEVCNAEMADVLVRLGAAVRVDLEGLQTMVNRAHGIVIVNEQINTHITRMADIVDRVASIVTIEIPAGIDQKLDVMNQKIRRSEDLRKIINRLNGIITSMNKLSSQIPDNLGEKVDFIERVMSRSAHTSNKYHKLNQILTFLKQIESIEIPDTTEILNRRTTMERKYNDSVKKRDQLMCLVDQIQAMRFNDGILSQQERQTAKDIEELKNKLNVCPTCGSMLDEVSRERLLHESN